MNQSHTKINRYAGKVLPGKPYPLGATYDGEGVNFALFSENATGVKLCLFFNPDNSNEYYEVDFQEVTDYVWHAYIPGINPGTQYGYRVFGRYQPKNGFRFNSQKMLIDPYAKAISGRVEVTENMFDYHLEGNAKKVKLQKNSVDSAGEMNKSVVIDTRFDWQGLRKPDIPMHNSIIYELHVKGFTATHPDIPESE